MNKARILFGLSCLVLLPLTAAAQNTTPGTAATYVMGQGWINVNVGTGGPVLVTGKAITGPALATTSSKWYHYGVIAGHSYCAEQVAERQPTVTEDGYVEVRREDLTTVIGSGDDLGSDSDPGWDNDVTPGRVCYIAPATEVNVAEVGNCCGATPNPDRLTYQFRVVETTLFSPWFFSGNGFEAFILMRNTTNSDLQATVTLRDTSGMVLGTQTGNVPANSSYNLQVSNPSPTGFGLANATGTVEIAFRGTNECVDESTAGAAGSLIATLTSISFASGVSFDTPFAPRQDWQR